MKDLRFVTKGSAEWDQIWSQLNALLGEGELATDDRLLIGWEYMGTAKQPDGKEFHQFRKRSCTMDPNLHVNILAPPKMRGNAAITAVQDMDDTLDRLQECIWTLGLDGSIDSLFTAFAQAVEKGIKQRVAPDCINKARE